MAEKLYQQGDYYSAISYYNNYLLDKKTTPAIASFTGYLSKSFTKKTVAIQDAKQVAAYQLANCHRLIFDYTNAETAYKKVLNPKFIAAFPAIEYYLGLCLRANGKPAEAKEQFVNFMGNNGPQSALYAAAQKELKDLEFAAAEAQKITRNKTQVQYLTTPINTKESNYAPYLLQQDLYFSSTRVDTTITNGNPYHHRLFKASVENGAINQLQPISFQKNNPAAYGAACFTADGKTMFFTQWELLGKEKIAAIYKSHQIDSTWSEPERLDTTINSVGYSSQQPFISADGKTIFFSSNKLGGLGNFDIWVAELNKNLDVKKVTNAGGFVNSKDNEKAPYFNAAMQTLIFASDGKTGFGGYDLYKSLRNKNRYDSALNLGKGINSAKDDIYFYAKETGINFMDDAWISSDRLSDCCLEIFHINVLHPLNHIRGSIKNAVTLVPINNANFTWKLPSSKIITVPTNEQGAYDLQVPDTVNNWVKIAHENYLDTAEWVTTVFTELSDTVFQKDFYLQPILPPVIKDYFVYFDFDQSNLLAGSMQLLDSVTTQLLAHPTWKLMIDGHTDAKGSDDYNLSLSKARAAATAAYFVQHGIDESRLVTAFYGKSQPIMANKTLTGVDDAKARAMNRRVKITIMVQP